jgi:hypothetical protein
LLDETEYGIVHVVDQEFPVPHQELLLHEEERLTDQISKEL